MRTADLYDLRTWTAFDVESSGASPEYALQPWAGEHSWLTSYALANIKDDGKFTGTSCPSYSTIVDINNSTFTVQEHIEHGLGSFLNEKARDGLPVVGWNVAFDVAWLIKMGFRDLVMQITWVDAMLLWRHLTRVPESDIDRGRRKRYGLKEAVAEFLPEYEGYDAEIDFHDMSPTAVRDRLRYNRYDAMFTLRIAQTLMHKMRAPSRKRQMRAWMLECKSIPLVADHYISGLDVDEDNAHDLDEALTAEKAQLLGELEAEGATARILGSPIQLRDLLFTQWELPIQNYTDKGAPSTDKEALYELGFLDPRAKKVARYREIAGLRTKFVTKVLESTAYNSDGKTHPTANIGATYTGRMTFSSSIGKNKEKRQTGFAIHQMKRAPEYRRNIKAPDGWMMVEWDAAGQEFRWVAIESGDPTMLALCEPGQDPHGYMAGQLSTMTYEEVVAAVAQGEKQAKQLRQAGKVGNLSCQYRIGPKSLLVRARVDFELDWDINTSKQVYNTYHATYPRVKQYWNRAIYQAQKRGYAETIAGRRVLLEGNWGGEKSWMLESTAINFPIQGVGADQKYLAMAAVKPLLTKYGGKFYFELHDGLYAIFPKKVAEKAAYEGRTLLSNLPYKKAWGFTPPIPLPWDLKFGPNWGDLEERE